MALLAGVAAQYGMSRAPKGAHRGAPQGQQQPDKTFMVDSAQEAYELMRKTDMNRDNVLDREEVALMVERNIKDARRTVKAHNKKVKAYRPWDVKELPKLLE